MATAVGLIILSIFIIKCIEILKAKSNMWSIKILSLYIIAVFFYFNTLVSNLIFFFFVFVFIFFTKTKLQEIYPANIYVVFLLYCCLTLSYSESLWYGSMMILKLLLPFIFLMIGYCLVDTREKFLTFLYRSQKYVIPLAILSSEPFVSLFKPYIKIFTSYEAGNT